MPALSLPAEQRQQVARPPDAYAKPLRKPILAGGERFGELTCGKYVWRHPVKGHAYLFRCDCGRLALRYTGQVRGAVKRGSAPMCLQCQSELVRGIRIAQHLLNAEHLLQGWYVTQSLYSPAREDSFARRLGDELQAAGHRPPEQVPLPASEMRGASYGEHPYLGSADWDELTLDQVGQAFGVSRERIRQIEAKALRKLRHPSRSKLLAPFLDRRHAGGLFSEGAARFDTLAEWARDQNSWGPPTQVPGARLHRRLAPGMTTWSRMPPPSADLVQKYEQAQAAIEAVQLARQQRWAEERKQRAREKRQRQRKERRSERARQERFRKSFGASTEPRRLTTRADPNKVANRGVTLQVCALRDGRAVLLRTETWYVRGLGPARDLILQKGSSLLSLKLAPIPTLSGDYWSARVWTDTHPTEQTYAAVEWVEIAEEWLKPVT